MRRWPSKLLRVGRLGCLAAAALILSFGPHSPNGKADAAAAGDFGFGDSQNNFSLFTNIVMSGAFIDNGTIHSDGSQADWEADYSLDLSPLSKVVDKGDLQFKVVLDATAYDETFDNDLPEIRIGTNLGKVVGYGEEEGNDEFNNVEGTVTEDTGWRSLSAGSRSISLKFYTTDGESGNNRAMIGKIRVYLKDNVSPLLTQLTVDESPGVFKEDDSITFNLKFDELVKADTSVGIPMNTGGEAEYVSGNYTDTLTYRYTVQDGDSQSNLNVKYGNPLNAVENTLQVTDLAGNSCDAKAGSFASGFDSATYRVDAVAPSFDANQLDVAVDGTTLGSSDHSAAVNADKTLEFTLYFTKPVDVTGHVELHFNNGGTATSESEGEGLGSLKFKYDGYDPDQDVNVLDFADSGALTGGTITDAAGNALNGSAMPDLAGMYSICIDDTAPAVSFDVEDADIWKKTQSVTVHVTDSGSGAADQFSYDWMDSNNVSDDNGTSSSGVAILSPSLTGIYHLQVAAYDKAGNVSVASDSASPDVKIDNTQPTITMTPNGSSSPQQRYSVVIQADDSEAGVDEGNVLFQWIPAGGSLNESGWRRATPGSAIDSASTGANSSGTWKLAVRASDQAIGANDQDHNVATVYSEDFVVDRDGPVITVSPSDGSEYVRSQQVEVSADDGTGSGVASLQYQWLDSENDPGSEGWSDVSDGAVASDDNWTGLMYLYVRAADRLGNVTTLHRSFLFDNTAPTVAFSPDGSLTASRDASVRLIVTEADSTPVALYTMWAPADAAAPEADDAGWMPDNAALSVDKTGGDGEWILYVKASDALGNTQIYASQPYLLDNTAPAGGLTIANPYTQDNVVPVQLTVDSGADDLGTVEYSVSQATYGGDWSDWSDWEAYSPNLSVTLPDQEGQYQIRVKYRDAVHNESPIYDADVTVDRTPPTADVQYSTTSHTKGTVTATLTPSETVTVTDDDGHAVTGHTFAQNGSFTLHLKDRAGNTADVTATVDWIYSERVSIAMTPDSQTTPVQATSVDVAVTDTWPDPVDPQLKYQWNQSPDPVESDWRSAADDAGGEAATLDGGAVSTVSAADSPDHYQFGLSGGDGTWYLHVEAFDSDGQPTVETSGPYVLDNTAPQATIVYSPDTPTGGAVKATLSFGGGENVTIDQPENGANYHLFTENGTYTFQFRDAAGNVGTATASVDWIDPSLSLADIRFSTLDLTNQPVSVTVSVYDVPGAYISQFEIPESMDGVLIDQTKDENDAVLSAIYSFGQNGTFYADIAYDGSDRTDRVPVTIDNIDTVAPIGSITYSKTDWTRGSVTATLSVSDNSGIVTVDGDAVHVFTENGDHLFTFTDGAGNQTTLKASVGNIDKEAPTGTVALSTTDWTNGPVTATLQTADNSGAPVTVTASDTSGADAELGEGNAYTFDSNGTLVYHLTDAAGNTADVTAIADHIDTTPPTGTVAYSGDPSRKTNQDVTATLTASDSQNKVTIVNNDGSDKYTFTANGQFDFELRDEAGNTAIVHAAVGNIDKAPPQADVSYSKQTLTNQNVTVTIKPNEQVVSTPLSHTFTENGTYDFELTDMAGNHSTIHTAVDYIDKTPPVANVVYSKTEPTSQPVTASLVSDESFVVANNQGSVNHVFYKNGSYSFVIMDSAGNMSTVSAVVNNIDSTPPAVRVVYSTNDLTNQPVTATLEADEPITVLNNGGSTSYTFTANGRFTFLVSDALGNQTQVEASVSNMDTAAPTLAFDRTGSLVFVKGEAVQIDDVHAQDAVDGDLTAQVKIDRGTFDASKPGSYTVTYAVTDRAGNKTTAVRSITILDPDHVQVFVNGQAVGANPLMMAGGSLHFDFLNRKGDFTISWKAGKLSRGGMKNNAAVLDGTDFQAPGQGWYTFYIQDQERNTFLVQIYVGAK